MGALLAIPALLLPSATSVISIAAACCGAATCSTLCSSCGSCQNSILTRIGYAIILLVNSILSWLMLTDWMVKKLEHLTMNYMKLSCVGKECYGFVAVHRLNFALGCFHLVLAILIGVNSSHKIRAPIQNGFWGPKIIAWAGLIVLTFLIPDAFFVAWGNYAALVGAMLFLLLGLVLLVDLAHTWAEYCSKKYEEAYSATWRYILIGSPASMYLASLAMTVVMYVYFAAPGCSMNQAAITINFILLFIVSYLSVSQTIQDNNPRAGLAQSAMVSVYCTYLTMSAVGMEPDDQHCNPLVRNQGTRTASIVVGAIVTFLTMAWTTTRAASYGLAGSPVSESSSNGIYAPLASEDTHNLITTQPESRRSLREASIRSLVANGSLPASALDESDDERDDSDEESGYDRKKDDERSSTRYNYTMFHIIFLLSTAWVATLLTMNVTPGEGENFVPVGRTYWASWVKIVSSWVCYSIYAWSLVAPTVMPDRFSY